MLVTGRAAAAPALRHAVGAFASADIPVNDRLQYGPMAQGAAIALWEEDGQRAILIRQCQLARTVGALDQLPVNLVALAIDDAWRGDFAGAVSLISECDAVCEATGGSSVAPFAAMFLGALRGNEEEVTPLIEATLAAAEAAGQGGAMTGAHSAAAVLHNGLGRYADAMAAAEEATRDAIVYVSILVVPELVEAAARAGNSNMTASTLQRWRSDAAQRQRSRPRHRGPLPGAAERRRDRRGFVSRGDRPAWPHPAAPGSGPGPPAVRRVAAPPGPAPRRAPAPPDRLRHARRDRHDGIRRARPPRADRHGREGT